MKFSIYNGPGDHTEHAYLNWRFWTHSEENEKLNQMSEFYLEATKTLLNATLKDNHDKKADSLIFPILFSFNHFIELKLKAILILYAKLEPDNEQILSTFKNDTSIRFKGHQINKYLDIIVKITSKTNINGIERKGKRFKYSKLYMDQLKEYDIFNESPNLDLSRYPLDKNNKQYFYSSTYDNVTISLINLGKMITHIEIELNGLYDQLINLDELISLQKEYTDDYYNQNLPY
ncbi:hypothetical protein CW676_03285 [Macrococcoides caseolyticum]|uniref:hypothetical protein n=1 Tax=Macrococcoides TaxID=3076173 RepID=UPI000C330455|nr:MULTISPECIES: hypothetical protein [Macrococcus]MCO4095951.1 hypothetical protein [Macrococcus canis]PKE07197.1 hypothetical protein CW692_04120 [Macrococcus caseolyticus]PKE24635.1 hypothetical protein CW689_02835 [Macrococcus caseolyticus]PKE53898.1 hypothetical protein CW676_03285 [Macrococcus caseolyticus]PKF39020.1 hypothetical protein CW681_03615 [Macrococcus caseolyticus]